MWGHMNPPSGSPAESSKLAWPGGRSFCGFYYSYEPFLKKSRHFHVQVKIYAGFVKAGR